MAGEPYRVGEGRISAAIAVLLGACSLLAVLCFHFPEYLTTPELRASYDVALLRNLLRAGMLAAERRPLAAALRRSRQAPSARLRCAAPVPVHRAAEVLNGPQKFGAGTRTRFVI